MNIRNTCPVAMDEQLLGALAGAINDRDLNSYKAEQLLSDAANNGQTCECETDDETRDDPDHECIIPMDADECRRQAEIHAQLAQAAATIALATATLLASPEIAARLQQVRRDIEARNA